MIATVSPSKVIGNLVAPASKSSMQRACAAALLHNGTTVITNAGISNDDKAAINIITSLGATVEYQNNSIIINSVGFGAANIPTTSVISCGESGLSFRMFSPIVALSSAEITLTGTGSLLTRPMRFFDEIFPQLEISIQSNNGHLPLHVKGPLKPHNIEIDGSLSSQFLTGLLFALSAACTQAITVTVNNLKSTPYIDLTLNVMEKFGYDIINHNYKEFIITPNKKSTNNINYVVEADWSSASFLLVAAAIGGNIKLSGLSLNSTQADKAIMNALKDCGAQIEQKGDDIIVSAKPLTAFTFDATDCPDLFPPLAALAAYCKGTTIIKGTHRLAAKESDRAQTLKDIFEKMGVSINLVNDEMHITGAKIQSAKVSSHHDHRIAMAAAIAAIGASGNIEIENADAINKSYPGFYTDLKTLGISLTTTA